VSVVRSYCLRRFFNAGLHKAIHRLSRWRRRTLQQPLLWPSAPKALKDELFDTVPLYVADTKSTEMSTVAVVPAGMVATGELIKAVFDEWHATGKTVSAERVKELARGEPKVGMAFHGKRHAP